MLRELGRGGQGLKDSSNLLGQLFFPPVGFPHVFSPCCFPRVFVSCFVFSFLFFWSVAWFPPPPVFSPLLFPVFLLLFCFSFFCFGQLLFLFVFLVFFCVCVCLVGVFFWYPFLVSLFFFLLFLRGKLTSGVPGLLMFFVICSF